MNYTIRPIEIQDLPQAYSLLCDLISQENLGKPLKMTIERMRNELFGPTPDWYGLVAAQDKELLGFCMYTISNTSRPLNPTPQIQIDDLYIQPQYRRQKIGENFIKELTKIALERHISRIELWCVKENALGQAFYKDLGARKLDHIDVFRFELDS
jgi:ribosomal protein S18 acetylase RimI-like enzyme